MKLMLLSKLVSLVSAVIKDGSIYYFTAEDAELFKTIITVASVVAIAAAVVLAVLIVLTVRANARKKNDPHVKQ